MTLLEIQKMLNVNRFYVKDELRLYGDRVNAHWLFGSVFHIKSDDGEVDKFVSGNENRYAMLIEKEDGMISPEDQKKARELERKKSNERITRQLKMKDSWDDKFKNTIRKQTTKKKSPFTVIEGGKK